MTDSEQTALDRGRALVGLQSMLKQGRISQEEFDEHRATLLAGGEVELPEPSSQSDPIGSLKPEASYEDSVVHWLRESAEQAKQQTTLIRSIRAWVTFFGILAVLSLVLWILLVLTA